MNVFQKFKTILFMMLITLFLLTINVGCISEGPRKKFRREMNEKMDALITVLKNYGLPDKSTKMPFTSSHSGNTFSSAPKAWGIAEAAKEVTQHFSMISIPFIIEGMDGIDDWSVKLKQDWERRKIIAFKEIQRIKKDYEKHPNNYKSFFGQDIGLVSDELYFSVGNDQGYVIERMLSIDINDWIVSLKKTISDYQN